MEGTNPPLLKGAGLSGTFLGPPHYPGLQESSRGGRVENGDQEKEGLGRMEGVPAPGDCGLDWVPPVALTPIPGWPTPSPQSREKTGRPSTPARDSSSRGPAAFAPPLALGPRRGRGTQLLRRRLGPSCYSRPAWDGGQGADPRRGRISVALPPIRAHKDDTRGPGTRAAALLGAAVRTHTHALRGRWGPG